MWTPRLLVLILSIGGVAWGLLCLPFLFWNPSYAIVIFGPGYVVTVGYLVRICWRLPMGARLGIWWLSAHVQGAWLIWALMGIAEGGWFRGGTFEWITLLWWLFATVASVLAALTERGTGPR